MVKFELLRNSGGTLVISQKRNIAEVLANQPMLTFSMESGGGVELDSLLYRLKQGDIIKIDVPKYCPNCHTIIE